MLARVGALKEGDPKERPHPSTLSTAEAPRGVVDGMHTEHQSLLQAAHLWSCPNKRRAASLARWGGASAQRCKMNAPLAVFAGLGSTMRGAKVPPFRRAEVEPNHVPVENQHHHERNHDGCQKDEKSTRFPDSDLSVA